MNLNSHLSFNGQCEAAFKFYEKCLGGKINMMMTYEESPMADKFAPEMAKKIIHGSIKIGGQELSGGDSPPNYYQKPQGFAVLINTDSVVEAERVFKALVEKGTVNMPLEETFWAARFGMLVDQFGTPWMINCGKPN